MQRLFDHDSAKLSGPRFEQLSESSGSTTANRYHKFLFDRGPSHYRSDRKRDSCSLVSCLSSLSNLIRRTQRQKSFEFLPFLPIKASMHVTLIYETRH